MASTSAVLIAQDAVARSDQPTNPRGDATSIAIVGGSGAQRTGYFQPSTPAVNANVTSAKLQLRQAGAAAAGSRTLSLYRVTSPWREDRLTWNNRPTTAATPTATVTVSGVGAEGNIVEFNVLSDVTQFFSGAFPNYGWVIESSTGNLIGFHSSESVTSFPTMVVEWSETPEPPTDMSPAGGAVVGLSKPMLRWSFLDLAGDTTLSAVQVHLKSTNTGWTSAGGYSSPTFDSGTVTTSQPQLDLATTAYAGIASGASVWWTVRHRDGAGLWSSWSDPQSLSYRLQQVVGMPYPSGSTINDTTFPVKWTATDQTQFEVFVRGRGLLGGRVLWTTGRTSSTAAREAAVPRGIIGAPGSSFDVGVRVWDPYAREDQPGAPAYVEVVRTVTYADSSSVTGVTDLAVVPVTDQPGVQLTWSRAAAAYAFAVWVDGLEHKVDAAAVFATSGTRYAYQLNGVSKDVEHTFVVKAIDQTTVSGTTFTRASSNNTAVTATVTPVGVWLLDPTDDDAAVRFLEDRSGSDIVTTRMPETTSTYEPVGSSTVVSVTTALRAMEGDLAGGVLADYGDFTADELRTRLLAMKGARTKTYTLVWGRQSLSVYLSDVNVVDFDVPGQQRYVASFSFRAAAASTEYQLS